MSLLVLLTVILRFHECLTDVFKEIKTEISTSCTNVSRIINESIIFNDTYAFHGTECFSEEKRVFLYLTDVKIPFLRKITCLKL